MNLRLLSTAGLALVLAACGQEGADKSMMDGDGEANPPSREMTGDAEPNQDSAREPRAGMADDAANRALLQAAVEADLRSEGAKARDEFRNPVETLMFFGVEPGDTVVEVWPGGGWYTDILAPYLASGGGKLYAAGFDPESENERVRQRALDFQEKYTNSPETYGDVETSALSADRQEIAPAGTADVVLTFRNAHNFVMGGWAEDAFASFYEALKPGGTLGVVDHRLPEEADAAKETSSGYVKVSTVRQLAEEAGFVFDAASEVNANPNDDADHPFGVWTLPPVSRTTGRDGTAPEGFDAEEYKRIGESDRMTLRFTKPEKPEEAMLE